MIVHTQSASNRLCPEVVIGEELCERHVLVHPLYDEKDKVFKQHGVLHPEIKCRLSGAPTLILPQMTCTAGEGTALNEWRGSDTTADATDTTNDYGDYDE